MNYGFNGEDSSESFARTALSSHDSSAVTTLWADVIQREAAMVAQFLQKDERAIGRCACGVWTRRSPRRMGVKGRASRSGLAVSELAICLPIMVLIVFGSLQMCNVIYLKHALVTAAYEGSLELAKSSTTNANVELRIQQVLEARRINDATIEILPAGANVATTPHGETLTIRITATSASNLSVTGFVTFPATMEHNLVCSR